MGKGKRRQLAAMRQQQQGAIPPPLPNTGYVQQQIRHQRVTTSVFSGPLPSPEDLIRYNEAFPGCSERIVAMAERQATHRQELETSVVQHNVRHDHRGQTLGFALSLVSIVGALGLIALGRPTEGLTVFFSNLTILVGMFVTGKITQSRELDRKKAEPPEKLPAPRRQHQ